MSTISIDSRFCGPPGSGNGGYVCGLLAETTTTTDPGAAVHVRLQRPPPLERALRVVQPEAGIAELFDGDALVARAQCGALDLAVPAWPGAEACERASQGFSGFADHAFPSCFVCGPQRPAGDGLRIFAGPLAAAPESVAAPWCPDPSLADGMGRVKPEFVWAALDCPGIFAFGVMPNPTVLGSFSVRIDARPRVGEPCAIVGWRIMREGRKRIAGTVLYDGAGRMQAVGHATWIELATTAKEG